MESRSNCEQGQVATVPPRSFYFTIHYKDIHMKTRFSYIESDTLKFQEGTLSGTNKNMIMTETSGEHNRFQTKDVEWNMKSLNAFLHSPVVFSGHEFQDGMRNRSSYMQTNTLVIDIDNTLNAAEVLSTLKRLPNSPLFHMSYSSNHDPNGTHKLHIVMPLSRPAQSLDEHDYLAEWVLQHFPNCDNKVRIDIARGIIRSNPTFLEYCKMGGEFPLSMNHIIDFGKQKEITTIALQNKNATVALKKGFAFTFTRDTIIYDANRNKHTIQSLTDILASPEYTSKPVEYQKIAIFCPLCGFDTSVRSEQNPDYLQQNALIRLGTNGLPYINCQSCGSRNEGADKKGSYFLASTEQMETLQKNKGFYVFKDKITDTWWECSYSKQWQKQVFYPLKTIPAIEASFWEHAKMEAPDIKTLPRCEFYLDFSNRKTVDLKGGFVNRYIPTKLMETVDNSPKPETVPELPKHIGSLLLHICGDCITLRDAFVDWLAYIYQERKKTYTAWIFQGTQGIGKDFLMDNVLRPIFGYEYCASIDQKRLASQFNVVLEGNIFLALNEIQADFSTEDANMIAARIKMLITDKYIQVEKKSVDIRPGNNNVNVMGFSNKYNAVRVEDGDRRFNICPRQERKLSEASFLPEPGNPKSLEKPVKEELLRFTMHLATRPVTEAAALVAYPSEEKNRLQFITGSYTDQFFSMIKPENIRWEWIQDNLNDDIHNTGVHEYVNRIIALPADDKERTMLPFRMAKQLFINVVLGGTKLTSQNFNHKLAQYKLGVKVVRIKGGFERVLCHL